MSRDYAYEIPAREQHLHPECKHWCVGYGCNADAERKAEGKCRSCMTNDANKRMKLRG